MSSGSVLQQPKQFNRPVSKGERHDASSRDQPPLRAREQVWRHLASRVSGAALGVVKRPIDQTHRPRGTRFPGRGSVAERVRSPHQREQLMMERCTSISHDEDAALLHGSAAPRGLFERAPSFAAPTDVLNGLENTNSGWWRGSSSRQAVADSPGPFRSHQNPTGTSVQKSRVTWRESGVRCWRFGSMKRSE
jgi:hypothetical protein